MVFLTTSCIEKKVIQISEYFNSGKLARDLNNNAKIDFQLTFTYCVFVLATINCKCVFLPKFLNVVVPSECKLTVATCN